MSEQLPAGSSTEFRSEAPRVWVRRYLPDDDAFLLAPLDDEAVPLVATIDKDSPGRGRVREALMEALFGTRRSLAPLRLLVREIATPTPSDANRPSPRRFAITDAFAERTFKDADARKIADVEGQVISRWSESLDEAVNHHGRLWLARGAVDYFSEMHPADFSRVRERAATQLAPEQADALPRDLLGALLGGELAHPRRYHPGVPLSLQVEGEPHPSQRANYAVQRALVDEFVDRMTSGLPALVHAQSTLTASGVLVAVHPVRTPESLRAGTREAARGIAAQTLAGLMELHGAEPATRDFDELWGPQPDGSLGRRATLHQEIVGEMAPHPIARSPNLREKTAAYLELSASRLARYDFEARLLVYQEQLKTAGPRKPRHPGTKIAADSAPKSAPAEPRMIALLQSGVPTAVAADHAIQTVVQAENIPWF